MKEARFLGTALLLISAFGFATLGISTRGAADSGLDTLAYVAWRNTLGGLVILGGVAAAAALGHRAFARRGTIPRREWLALAAASTMAVGVQLSIFGAFNSTTIAIALITFYSFPALVTLAAVRVYGERLEPRQAAALALASVGLILVALGPVMEGAGVRVDLAGIGLAFAAAIFQTVYSLIIGRGFNTIPSGFATAVIVGVAGLVSIVLAIVVGQGSQLGLPFDVSALWPWILLAVVVGAAIPTAANVTGIRLLGPSRASILMMIEPVVGVALAAVFLAERPVPLQFLGGAAVIIAGVVLQSRRRSSVVV
ncbi:MAG: DMT family transporter [Chloroflexi bacterium]|nr:DMT family transporter [Chloroflexota bacterium]